MSSKLNELLKVTAEEKKAILDHYNITEEQFEENVKQLKEWINQSAHLPKEKSDGKLKICLLNCKMSMERAKQCMEGYYTVRTIYSDIFDNLNPSSEVYKKAKPMGKFVVLPKLTPNLCRVVFCKIEDPEGEATDGIIYHIVTLMITELRINIDYCLANSVVVDFSEYCLKNMLKFTPSVNQKLVHMLIAMKMRVHSVHFINCPPFLDTIMILLKKLLPSHIMNKIIIHQNLESLYKEIPKECLPSNYGGYEKSLDELYEDWCRELEDKESYFDGLVHVKSTRKIEIPHQGDEIYGTGSDGSFKKLAID